MLVHLHARYRGRLRKSLLEAHKEETIWSKYWVPSSVPSSQTEQRDYSSRVSFLSSFPFRVALVISQFTLVCMKQQTFRFVQRAG